MISIENIFKIHEHFTYFINNKIKDLNPLIHRKKIIKMIRTWV